LIFTWSTVSILWEVSKVFIEKKGKKELALGRYAPEVHASYLRRRAGGGSFGVVELFLQLYFALIPIPKEGVGKGRCTPR
jgi:hypothetical protein